MVSHIIAASFTTRSKSRSFTISTLTPHGNMHLYFVAQLVMSFLGARWSSKNLNISMKIPRWSFFKHEHNHTIVLITTLGKVFELNIWSHSTLSSFEISQTFQIAKTSPKVQKKSAKNNPRLPGHGHGKEDPTPLLSRFRGSSDPSDGLPGPVFIASCRLCSHVFSNSESEGIFSTSNFF